MADKYEVKINKLESTYPLSAGTLPRKRSPFSTVKATQLNRENSIADKVAVVIYDTMAGSEHEDIKDSFEKMDDWQVISIAKLDLKHHGFKNEGSLNISKQLQYAWKIFNDNIAKYDGSYPEIFANKYLNFQFRRIWDEMELSVEYASIFLTVLDILKPSVIILGHEAFTVERVFVALSKKKDIPTVGLLHGGFGHRLGYKGIIGDSDSILVWNDVDVTCLKLYGEDESKLLKIGCIRYEAKYKKYTQKLSSGQKEINEEAKRRIRIRHNCPAVLIVTAAINSGFSAPIANPKEHREAFDELLKLVITRKDLTFIIKAHPSYDYYEIYRRLHSLNLPNLVFLENATLDEAIEASDVCLLINNFTTAALEAMLYQIPVIYLNNAVYDLPGWEENIPDFNINRIHSVFELESKIDALLNNTGLKENTFVESDKIIRKILDINGRSPYDRLTDFIISISKKELTCTSIPENIYRKIYTRQHRDNTGEKEVAAFLNQIVSNHSIEDVLYSVVFIAGSNNAGVESIFIIFNTIRRYLGGENLAQWNELRWILLHYYILGYSNNSNKYNLFSAIQLIGWLLRYPKKTINMPVNNRNQIFKYLVKAIAGKKVSTLAKYYGQ
ncbi:MAG: hypothetical protein V4560_10080 [Bacteroidota bacterium]